MCTKNIAKQSLYNHLHQLTPDNMESICIVIIVKYMQMTQLT